MYNCDNDRNSGYSLYSYSTACYSNGSVGNSSCETDIWCCDVGNYAECVDGHDAYWNSLGHDGVNYDYTRDHGHGGENYPGCGGGLCLRCGGGLCLGCGGALHRGYDDGYYRGHCDACHCFGGCYYRVDAFFDRHDRGDAFLDYCGRGDACFDPGARVGRHGYGPSCRDVDGELCLLSCCQQVRGYSGAVCHVGLRAGEFVAAVVVAAVVVRADPRGGALGDYHDCLRIGAQFGCRAGRRFVLALLQQGLALLPKGQ